jgi:ketol-acid reductoisomerase
MSLDVISGPDDAFLGPLRGRRVGIVGFGNQGAAHAMNLRESGIAVRVANRAETPAGRCAVSCGFEPEPINVVAAESDLLIIALPDEVQPEVWRKSIEPHLQPPVVVGFLHGFAIRYGLISASEDVGVIMVAPKGPGRTLRDRFLEGRGIPCLFAIHQPGRSADLDAEALGLAWAAGIGCARAAIVRTTFADETETDLFGEQAVLCGGLTGLIIAAFETLVDAGYPPELAYLECCHEVKQVADLIYERGPAGMMEVISNTAEFGACRAMPRLVDASMRDRLRELLEEVRDGRFAAAMRADHADGFRWFGDQRSRVAGHPIEAPGKVVRSWMPWLAPRDEE